MSAAEGEENVAPQEHERSPLAELSNQITPGGRRCSTGDPALVKRFTIRSVDHENSQHAVLNAKREVKRLKSQVQEKDRQLANLDRQLCVTKGQLEELQLQEQKHRNASKEIKKQLSSQETSVRAKSAALARVSGQLQRVSAMEESRSRRKTLQIKELNAEFERMEESYCSQLCVLEEELSGAKVALEEGLQAAASVSALEAALAAQTDAAAEREQQLCAELESLQNERLRQTALLTSREEQAAHAARELQRSACLHQLRLLAVQRQYEELFESVAGETQKEMISLTDMQRSVREEQEKQMLQFAKLYQSFEEQREEKIDAQLRVVSLVTDLASEKAARATLQDRIDQLDSELTVARELTEEVSRGSASNARLQRERIAALEGEVLARLADAQSSAELAAALTAKHEEAKAEAESLLNETKTSYEQQLKGERALAAALREELSAVTSALDASVTERAAQAQEYSAERAALEAELESLSLKWQEVKLHLEEEKARSADALACARRAHAELTAERVAERREHLATMKCFQDSVDELTVCLERENARCTALEDRNARDLSAHKAAVSALESRVAELQRAHAAEAAVLEERLMEATAAREKVTADRAREKSIGGDVIKALKASNAELTAELTAEREKHAEALTVVAAAKEARAVSEQRCSEMAAELSSMQTKTAADLDAMQTKMSEMVEAHQQENASYERLLSQQQQRLAQEQAARAATQRALQREYDDLSSQRSDDIAAMAKSHDAEVQRLSALLEESAAESLRVKYELSREQSAHSQALSAVQEECEEMRRRLAAGEEREEAAVSAMEQELLSLRRDRADQVRGLTQRLDETRTALQAERTEREQCDALTQAEVGRLQQLLCEARMTQDEECVELRGAVAALQQRQAELLQQMEAERAEHHAVLSKALEYNASADEHDEEVAVLTNEMDRYKALYEKAVEENDIFTGHANNGQKIRYVMELKQQINALLEENHTLSMKTANLNHNMSVMAGAKAAKHHP